MSIELSRENEVRLTIEARRQGISVDALVERLMGDHESGAGARATTELPIWHLGEVGSLHRPDIYDDARLTRDCRRERFGLCDGRG